MLEYDNDPCNGCNYPLCAVCPYRDTESDKQSNEPKKYNNEQTKKKKRKRK